MSIGYALLCGRLALPPILAVGAEAVLASAEPYEDPERATQVDQAGNPDMHAVGNAGHGA